MKEYIFVKQNKEKWIKYEKKISHLSSLSTQQISDIYQDLTADLAYAQGHYPGARVTAYLNNLALMLHEYVCKPKKHDFRSIIKFFTEYVPSMVAEAHVEMKLSFAIFMTFTIAGVILASQDIQNIINTLGPRYVEMTLENIKNGVPTDVYGHSDQGLMFYYIVLNNIKVDLITYMYGIIPILGPGYILKVNGVMLGEFQTLFFLKGVGLESMSAIWIHGALEIPSIIISGAASLALGMGWVFPGTLSRKEALKRSGLRSVKIILSVLPITIFAAFLESFATRHTEWPLFVKLFIIGGSLAFVIFYYIYLPHKIRKRKEHES